MGLEPIVILLVGVEVVEDDMQLLTRIGGDHLVHEVEELDTPAAFAVSGRHLAAGDLEGGEQSGARPVTQLSPSITSKHAGSRCAIGLINFHYMGDAE